MAYPFLSGCHMLLLYRPTISLTPHVSRAISLVFGALYSINVSYMIHVFACIVHSAAGCNIEHLYRTTNMTFAIPAKRPSPLPSFLACLLAIAVLYNLTVFVSRDPDRGTFGLLLYHTCRLLAPLRDQCLGLYLFVATDQIGTFS